jgi:hypothetical protein
MTAITEAVALVARTGNDLSSSVSVGLRGRRIEVVHLPVRTVLAVAFIDTPPLACLADAEPRIGIRRLVGGAAGPPVREPRPFAVPRSLQHRD